MYLILLTCLSLAITTTSCNNDEFDLNASETQKQYTKAELIKLAENYAPRTRSSLDPFLIMYTIKDTVAIRYFANEDTVIDWGDGTTDPVSKGDFKMKTYQYNDNIPAHRIRLLGTESAGQAIKTLHLNDN